MAAERCVREQRSGTRNVVASIICRGYTYASLVTRKSRKPVLVALLINSNWGSEVVDGVCQH